VGSSARARTELREADPDAAETWRDAVADGAAACLEAGMLGVAFDRERSAYVFVPADEAGVGG
jgi:predicted GNAT superfamily acetyltransferase